MTGDVQDLDKESFWKEHQDTLVRIRYDLQSGKKSRSKFSPANGIRKRTPNGPGGGKSPNHPPYGKYRRTPSPYLPKLSPQPDVANNSPRQNGVRNKFEVVPPVKPKMAFTKKPIVDYDSWGEEEDDDDFGEEDEEDDDGNVVDVHGRPYGNKTKSQQALSRQRRKYKPQPYPAAMPTFVPQVVYGAPFPVYYPPPPKGSKQIRKYQNRRSAKSRTYKDIYRTRKLQTSLSVVPVSKNLSKKKKNKAQRSMPMFAQPYPMMPAMPFVYPQLPEEDEDEDDEDDMMKQVYAHWRLHPLFASDFVDWFIGESIDTELLPDFLIQILTEMKHMPYDHPLYVPSLYACEDFISDNLAELVVDVVREVAAEAANDYLDEKSLKRDPLEDFLTDLIEDAVRSGTRDIVRTTIVGMAEDYMEIEFGNGLIDSLVGDYVDEIKEDLLEEALFDLVAEDFIKTEVVASEVKEESEVIAREVIDYYDTKVMRREFKEISQQAQVKLADVVMAEFMLHLISQQGKIWTEDDHYNKYLDDFILNTGLSQMFHIQRQRDKTVQCKPLHKLHEKVVSDVAMDVFLQHLTRSLDEDLADVDEYERGVTDGTADIMALR